MSSMALYMIGDVQGCDAALGDLLEKVAFSPSRDRLILLGDLVNRGPASLAVLRRMVALGDAAACLLGNHDLHLLAVSQGVRKPHRSDTVADILAAPDRDALLDWLRHRPLALHEHGVLMVHAGVLPQWTVVQTLVLATEVEKVLQAAEWADFMHQMYGNQPDRWRAYMGFQQHNIFWVSGGGSRAKRGRVQYGGQCRQFCINGHERRISSRSQDDGEHW